jgi:hypothetical protein
VECDTGGLLLVSFIDDLKPELRPARPVETAKDASRVAQLERELEATREDLQSAIRDLDIANEELFPACASAGGDKKYRRRWPAGSREQG